MEPRRKHHRRRLVKSAIHGNFPVDVLVDRRSVKTTVTHPVGSDDRRRGKRRLPWVLCRF